MDEMHYFDLLNRVERTVSDVVRRCCPASWDEDHITYSVTDELAKLKHVEVQGLNRPFKVTWDARKFRGTPERLLGDLGVLVRISGWDGEEIEGVGLLEAKKRSLTTSSFEAVRRQQLARMEKNAPRSRLLLYDHSDVTEFVDNLLVSSGARPSWFAPFWPHGFEPPRPFSNAVVVPTNLALTIKKCKTSLYKYSLPFSVQLCGRYFRGLDLEFKENVLRQAKGFFDRTGGVRYLLLVGISTGPNPPEPPSQIDSRAYGPLGGDPVTL